MKLVLQHPDKSEIITTNIRELQATAFSIYTGCNRPDGNVALHQGYNGNEHFYTTEITSNSYNYMKESNAMLEVCSLEVSIFVVDYYSYSFSTDLNNELENW